MAQQSEQVGNLGYNELRLHDVTSSVDENGRGRVLLCRHARYNLLIHMVFEAERTSQRSISVRSYVAVPKKSL